jgi:Type I phosphodiesterase / nucleotide pyrophosphatase
VAAALVSACTTARPSVRATGAVTPCALPPEQVVRIEHGYYPGRSGDVQIVPAPPNYFSATRTHSGPWNYLQEVPLFLYGPGHVPEVGKVATAVTAADIAPTLAGHLRFPFESPDGRALEAALPEPSTPPPRLIVVVVWDGAGRNVLARHPDAWPNLRGMIGRGVWYERATVGTSPSTTAQVHATIGTGAFPSVHGRVTNDLGTGPGEGPDPLLAPSLADAWDRSNGNAPAVGLLGLRSWHLGMMGDGAWADGGDRDPVVLVDEGTSDWGLPRALRPGYRFPPAAAAVPGLRAELRALDRGDGHLDGAWLGEPVLDDPGDVIATPAFTRWQSRLVERVLLAERFGADDLTDMLFINVKQIDLVGHRWGMNAPQARAVVRASDTALADLVELLDRSVGIGDWVLAVTADHGSTPPARATGGWVIDPGRLLADIRLRFDRDGDDRSVLTRGSPSQLWLDEEEMVQEGIGAADVAGFVARYTIRQNARDPAAVPEHRRDIPLFRAAFPSDALSTKCPG